MRYSKSSVTLRPEGPIWPQFSRREQGPIVCPTRLAAGSGWWNHEPPRLKPDVMRYPRDVPDARLLLAACIP